MRAAALSYRSPFRRYSATNVPDDSLRGETRPPVLFGGTSAAAPQAAAIVGLFLVSKALANPSYFDTHAAVDALPELLRVATDPARPTPGIGDGTSFVNAELAVGVAP